MHIALFFSMMLFAPEKKVEKTPLLIKTVIQAPSSHLPKATKAQKAIRKKPIKAISPVHTHPQVPTHLVQALQESIAKIDQNLHKGLWKSNLETPIAIPTLKIESGSCEDRVAYTNELIACLKRSLILPEVGEVRGRLVLQNRGSLKEFRMLSCQSERNQRFLETELGRIRYPSFTGSLKSEKEHLFVVTFSNH